MAFDAGAIYGQMQLDLGPFNAGLNQAFNAVDRASTSMTAHMSKSQAAANLLSASLQQGTTRVQEFTGAGVLGLGKMVAGFALAQLGVTSLMAVFSKLTGLIHQGIKEAEDFHQATIRLTAAIQDSHPEIPYERAQKMAAAFVGTSRELGAQIGITSEEVAGITRGVQEFGIGVNLATKQGQADFQALLMSLKTYHAGMDLATSSTRELNAIFNELTTGGGGGGAFTALATRLKEMDPHLKAHVIQWQEIERSTGQTGYTLSKLSGMLAGVNASIEAEKGSWQAIHTVLNETVNHILRDTFTPVIQDIAGILRQVNVYLNEHGDQIRGEILAGWQALKVAAKFVWDAVAAVYNILATKIGEQSLGHILLQMAAGAGAFVALVGLVRSIQTIAIAMQLGVSPLSVGAAIIALASPAILEGASTLGAMVGRVGAGPAEAESAAILAATQARVAGTKGFTTTSQIIPAPSGAEAIIPGAPPESTLVKEKAAAEERKKALQELRAEQVAAMEAQAELLDVQGRTLEAEAAKIQAGYYKVIYASNVTASEIVSAQQKAAALTEKAWMKTWETAQQGLREYQAAHASTMNEISGYEKQLAELRGEQRGESKADVLKDEAAAVQKVRDDEHVSIEERVKAGAEEVTLERERLAAAKASGVGIVEAEQALSAARREQITLLEQASAKAQARSAEEIAGIEKLQAQITNFQAAYKTTIDFLRANMNNAGNEVYRQWVKELPDSIEERWSKLNLRRFLVLGGETGGGPSIGAPNVGTVISGDVHVVIPGTGLTVPEIADAVRGALQQVANSQPQPEGGG